MKSRRLTRHVVGLLGFVFLFVLVASAPLQAGSFMDKMKDPEDGRFDLSRWLGSRKGFLPVPIIITEPAIGPGLGLAAVFFHQSIEEMAAEAKAAKEAGKEGRMTPPSVSVGFGMYTENDSWMAGGGHMGVWKNDRIRYIGGLGLGEFNLQFFGTGENPILGEHPLDYNIELLGLVQDLRFRLGDSDLFLGARYLLIDTLSTFEIADIPGIPVVELDSRTAGLNLVLAYDDRDNAISPNRGWNVQILGGLYDEWLGGDFEYERLETAVTRYQPLGDRFGLGMRYEGTFSDGDTPFYHLPTLLMRGLQAGQYMGKHAVQFEAELKWKIEDRWRLVTFGGVGRRASSFDELSSSENVFAGGVGFRYLMARLLGLESGLDFAWDEDGNFAFYITAGSAWR